jgi:hypothetical protein
MSTKTNTETSEKDRITPADWTIFAGLVIFAIGIFVPFIVWGSIGLWGMVKTQWDNSFGNTSTTTVGMDYDYEQKKAESKKRDEVAAESCKQKGYDGGLVYISWGAVATTSMQVICTYTVDDPTV